ncbi:MAG: DNA polymerase IV [Bacilli bacterium]|nr:DNA polymerase IV [Bacilli bacterium]
MSKIILHVDLNKFFVRCEELKNPYLIGKPVVVGGDGRKGSVSTCSYEARKFGIHSGMPTFQAKMLCKDLIIISGDYKYYELMSKEFINFIKKRVDVVEQLSIDECYCDITNTYKQLKNKDINAYLKDLQNDLFKQTKLNCSIGVAATRFLAKMGSDYKKPNGITIIRKKDIPNIIFPLKIGNYYGIGKKTAPKLEQLGYNNIGELYYGLKNNDEKLKNFFGSMRDDIIAQLEGRSNDIVTGTYADAKSIGNTRTLDHDSDDRDYIKDFYIHLVNNVTNDFLKEDMLTKTIQITYKSAEHDDDGFKTKTYSKSFDNYTKDKKFILKEALNFFDATYKNQKIRLIGFTLKNLVNKHDITVQMTFDDYMVHESENKTQLLINQLNRDYNKEIFMRLSDLKDKKNEN